MSAPTTSPRPVTSEPASRPTRPVQRTAPARAPQPRTGSSRAGTSRTATSRTATPRTGVPRTATARTGTPRTGATTARTVVPTPARRAVTAGATALAMPTPASAPSVSPRTRIRVLHRPQTGGRRLGFAVTCTAMLGALMLGLLLLNVAISGNAFTVAELQSQRSVLVDQQQSLEQQLLLQGSPSSLAARARALGMVPSPQVIVLAPDGTGAPPVEPVP